MLNLKHNKLIHYLVTAILIILLFVLFGMVRNLSIALPGKINLTGFTIILFLSIGSALLLFLTYQWLYKTMLMREAEMSQIIDEKTKIIDTALSQKKEKNTNADESVKKETFKLEEILNRILIPDIEKGPLDKSVEICLINLSHEMELVQGMYFAKTGKSENYHYISGYAYYSDEKPIEFKEGESISGQVAKNKKLLVLQDIPVSYFSVISGLGKAKPTCVIIAPVVINNNCIGVFEFAFFKTPDNNHINLLEQLATRFGTITIALHKLSQKADV